MTQEEKSLLLQDLCARLPYGVKVNIEAKKKSYTATVCEITRNYICVEGGGETCFSHGTYKPYLRPISSMTEEEQFQLGRLLGATSYNLLKGEYSSLKELLEYVYKNHIDLFGLIPKGLALEAPKDMYNTKTE